MRFSNSVNINAASAATNQSGLVIDAAYVSTFSAQAVVTGTSTGTLNIQASNDPSAGLAVASGGTPIPTHWSNIATIGTVAIAGAGTYLIPKFDVAYRWMRCSFVATNGAAGTITVNVMTQGPG